VARLLPAAAGWAQLSAQPCLEAAAAAAQVLLLLPEHLRPLLQQPPAGVLPQLLAEGAVRPLLPLGVPAAGLLVVQRGWLAWRRCGRPGQPLCHYQQLHLLLLLLLDPS
jgi:hypothetical protein